MMAQCLKYFIAYALLAPFSQGEGAEMGIAEPAKDSQAASNTVASSSQSDLPPPPSEPAAQSFPEQPLAEPAGDVSTDTVAPSPENKTEASDALPPERPQSETPSFADKQQHLQFLQQIEQNLQQWEHQLQQWKLQLQDKAQQLIHSGPLQESMTPPKVQPEQTPAPQDPQAQSEPTISGQQSFSTANDTQQTMNHELAKILERKERKRLKKRLADQATLERFRQEKVSTQTPTENSSPQPYQAPGLDDRRRQFDHDRKVRVLSSELGRMVEIDEHGNQSEIASNSAQKARVKSGENLGKNTMNTFPDPSFTAPVSSGQR